MFTLSPISKFLLMKQLLVTLSSVSWTRFKRDSTSGKETLEGHLRGVLATLTPEEVNEDRLKFAQALMDEADTDFDKLGLHLDTLKIQNVTDTTNYLESIGRRRIAEVIRDAEIAESTAKAESKEMESQYKQEAKGRYGNSSNNHCRSRECVACS